MRRSGQEEEKSDAEDVKAIERRLEPEQRITSMLMSTVTVSLRQGTGWSAVDRYYSGVSVYN